MGELLHLVGPTARMGWAWPQPAQAPPRCTIHVLDVVRGCHFHIRALRHIRPLLTLDAAKTFAVAIVSKGKGKGSVFI